MNAEVHKFQPEEVMAYLDGEVTGERALALAEHLQQCAECASLADDFRSLSQELIAWKIEPSPLVESPAIQGVEALTAEEAMGAFKSDRDSIAASLLAQEHASAVGRKSSLLSSFLGFIRRPRVQGPWVWALGSACAVLLIVSLLLFRMVTVAPSQSAKTIASYQEKYQDELARALQDLKTRDELARSLHDAKMRDELKRARQEAAKLNDETSEKLTALDTSVHTELATKVDTTVVPAQMIERTASLSMIVKEMDAARAALEDIAKRHHGYFAELSTEGQSEAGRTLSASVRVPAGELDGTLAELRKLGHLDEEKQGGEEVSQQHVDLEARLKNARNTEKRLTDLLIKRADKLKDVLDVERELASTREEIERMEAQLRNMENQVGYASIELRLRQEYKPVLNLAPPATGTRLRNALVNGYHSAVESALGLVLFLFQEGPTLLFWLLLLFFPARWTWRKLRTTAVPKQSLAGAL